MYNIVITEYFKKQLKRLVKKNRKLKDNLIKTLKYFNKSQAICIGMGVYKIRIKGQNKGKSGGYRLYIFIVEIEGILSPVYIYPKNERENLKLNDLTLHLECIKNELENM